MQVIERQVRHWQVRACVVKAIDTEWYSQAEWGNRSVLHDRLWKVMQCLCWRPFPRQTLTPSGTQSTFYNSVISFAVCMTINVYVSISLFVSVCKPISLSTFLCATDNYNQPGQFVGLPYLVGPIVCLFVCPIIYMHVYVPYIKQWLTDRYHLCKNWPDPPNSRPINHTLLNICSDHLELDSDILRTILRTTL